MSMHYHVKYGCFKLLHHAVCSDYQYQIIHHFIINLTESAM